jgi:RNA polymerase sigma-70 factor (ECF subfamily)
VRAREDERFKALLQRYGPSLRRLCALYESNHAERDDLMQEVAFAIWRGLRTFRGECSERTFIYRIAHNRVLSYRFRKRLAMSPLSEADGVADPSTRADASAERSSERAHLLEVVRRLPESLREPVVLRLEGLSDREISAVLGISEGNVAVRLTRARNSLRQLLAAPSTDTTR